jgi:hypothetical protein
MDASEVQALLAGIAPPAAPDHFPLVQLGANLYLGRSHQGEAALVVTYPWGMNPQRGRETKGLRLIFHAAFALELNGKTQQVSCGLLLCGDKSFDWAFSVMVAGMADRLATNPGWLDHPSALIQHVGEWQTLLANQPKLTQAEEIGLWGELHLLLQTPSPVAALSHWHGPEAKRFDFSAPGLDVEVKTSLTGHTHHFRLEQLAPSPSGSERLICSLVVEEDLAGGTTLDDIVAEVRRYFIDPIPFDEKLVRLGWRPDPERTLALSLRESRFVPTHTVPSVVPSPGVTEVSFVSDLSRCPALTPSEIKTRLAQLSGAPAHLVDVAASGGNPA